MTLKKLRLNLNHLHFTDPPVFVLATIIKKTRCPNGHSEAIQSDQLKTNVMLKFIHTGKKHVLLEKVDDGVNINLEITSPNDPMDT